VASPWYQQDTVDTVAENEAMRLSLVDLLDAEWG
jgi:hypothetical protein